MIEADLMRLIQVHASKLGARLLRNNVGALQNKEGTWIRYGLGVGTADLVGWLTVDGAALFLAVEVKSESGRVSPEQTNFINAVRAAGGRAGIARSVQDAEDIILGNASTASKQ